MITETAFIATVAVPNFVVSCVEVAVIVAVPAPEGVNTPAALIVPPAADHVTAELKAPVPVTFAVHADVCVVRIVLGAHVTATDEIVDAVPTETVAVPIFVVSCTEVAVIVALAVPAGVNTPAAVIDPLVAVQVTALLKFPAPETVAVQAVVWFGRIEVGLQTTLTDEIVEESFTETRAVPELLVSCVAVAVMVAVPAPDGVNNPAGVIVPFVADQVTEELNAPVPETVAEHWLDWPV